MTRTVLCLTLALAWLLAGCGGSSTTPSDAAADDAAHADSGAGSDTAVAQDSGGTTDGGVARNTGIACTDDSQCTGLNATCLKQMTGVPVIGTLNFPGGYCTSDCGPNDDCGPDGYCLNGTTFGMPIKCMKKCTQTSECRAAETYTCTDILQQFPQTMCFPPLQ